MVSDAPRRKREAGAPVTAPHLFDDISPQTAAVLESRLTQAFPILSQRWATYLTTLPPEGPVPDLNAWLIVLQSAINGREVSEALQQLWRSGNAPATPLLPLPSQTSELLNVTFSCLLRKSATSPEPAFWHALLVVQNRIMSALPAPDGSSDDKPQAGALALERALRFDEMRQRLAEVTTLYDLARQLTTSLNLEEVLNSIVVNLRQVMNCRGCCIFLLDEDSQLLEIKAADGLKPKWRDAARLRVGEGAAGRAVANQEVVYIPDTHQDPTFIFFDEAVRSLMVIPLQTKNKVIGAINVDDSRPNAFGPAQERLLTIAAAQAAIAIENARLFSEVLSEQQLTQAIIQHMADGLLMMDRQGEIVRCNPALAGMLGMRIREIVGQNVHAASLDPRLAAICGPATQRERTGVLANEITLEEPHPRALRIFASAVTDETGDIIGEVRVVHDVTKQRELDQMKDDFVSTVSHELRTPLFSIQGFVRLMLDEPDLDKETRREFLSIIERQTNNLAEMVANLLDLSRLAEGRLDMVYRPVQMLDIIRQTVLKLRGYAHRQGVRLLMDLPSSLPVIHGDAQRLEQVITNLLGNALKFTEKGGQVEIKAWVDGDQMLVAVTDTGIGIPAEELEHIFSKFYQIEAHSEHSVTGSGLGLHITRQIVEGHRGRIWATSQVGTGSTLTVSLPLGNEEPE